MSDAVLLTADCNDESYLNDQVSYFFGTRGVDAFKSLSQVDKERFFKLLTDHEAVLTKLIPGLVNSSLFFPVALRNGSDDETVKEYKTWLEKQ